MPNLALRRLELAQRFEHARGAREIAEGPRGDRRDLEEQRPLALRRRARGALEQIGRLGQRALALQRLGQRDERPDDRRVALEARAIDRLAEDLLRERGLTEALRDRDRLDEAVGGALARERAQRGDHEPIAIVGARDAQDLARRRRRGSRADRRAQDALRAIQVARAVRGVTTHVDRALDEGHAAGIAAREAQLREAIERLRADRRGRAGIAVEPDAPFEQRLDLGHLTAPHEQRVERVPHGVEPRRVRGLGEERLGRAVRVARAIGVAEVFVRDLGDREMKPRERRGSRLDRGSLRGDREELVERALRAGERERRRDGLRIGRRSREDLHARAERRGATPEMRLVDLRELPERRERIAGLALREHLLVALRQEIEATPRAQRGHQTITLVARLARGLHRRFEVLRGAIGLADRARQLRQLEEHLGAADVRPAPLFGLPNDQEERAVHARGALDLALLQREAGEREEHAGVTWIDADRGVEFGESARAIARRERGPAELEVDERPLLGAARAVRREHVAERGGRVGEAATFAERAREIEAQRQIVGRELRRLLQERDRR